jgi:FkbM family methyltransferase
MQLLIKGIFYRIQKLLSSPYRQVGIGFIKEKTIKHTRNNKTKVVNINKFPISYTDDASFILSLEEIFFSEIYKTNLEKNKRIKIIDCGSNIGMSLLYFKMNYNNCEIVAFEPDQKNYELLESNTNKWKFSNISINKKAIWKENGEISFSNSGNLGGKIDHSTNSADQTNLVPTIRLKDLLIEKIDLLKIDIEGAEYEVIKDCKDDLHCISNLFIEYHGKFSDGGNLIELLNIINNAGFGFYIKEAADIYPNPFVRTRENYPYEVQLNIFAFRS